MNKNKKILITGTSGFIGFSLALNLLKKGHKILGYDSINNYYDVNLKHSRNKILKKLIETICPCKKEMSKKHYQIQISCIK